MAPTKAQILAKVNATPGGLRTREIVQQLGGNANSVGAILSKLCAYGVIEREILNKRRDSVWKPRRAQTP